MQVEMELSKQQFEDEMKQQEEDRLQALEERMTDDELKYQNEKLRIAFRKLTNDIEVERAEWETTKHDLQEQAERVPELEEKLADIDVLLEAVEERDEELEAMRETVEEAGEFQQMVEELTEEIVEKEETIEELEQKVNEMEEVQAVQEEINANQEIFEKEMQDEIVKKEVRLQELENDVQILEEAVLEQDEKETKHKERLNEVTKENELLKEQLNSAYDEQTKNKISDLISKQKKLSLQLRESSRKEIDGSLTQINVGILNTLADLYYSFVPEKLLKEAYVSNFNKIRLLVFVKHKAHLLYNELCKQKLIESSEFLMGDGKEESYAYFKYMCKLGNNCMKCLNICTKMIHALTHVSQEDYMKITDLPFWQNFVMADSFLDNMLKMIRDDTLTTKIDQTGFEETLSEFESFHEESIKSAANTYMIEQTQQSDYNVDDVPKIVIKENLYKIAFAILALGFYLRLRDFYLGNEVDNSLQSKCNHAFYKLMDAVPVIEEIEQAPKEINYVKRLSDKFEFVSKFWEEDSMAFDQEDQKQSETTEETKDDVVGEGESETPSESRKSQSSKINYDWFSWVDSVERDLLSIMSDGFIQDIKDRVKKEHTSPFLKKVPHGPWVRLAEETRSQLSKSDLILEDFEKLKEKVKDQNISYVKLKKQKDDLEIIRETHERKIGELEMDRIKMTQLQDDKKRVADKLDYLQKEMENKEKIINTQKSNIDKLNNEIKEIQKKKPDEKHQSDKRPSNKMSIIGKLINKKTEGGGKTQTVVDESMIETLNDLQEENIRLKRSKMFERMQKLSESTPAFASFMRTNNLDHSSRNNIINLTDEEAADVHSSVYEINSIKEQTRESMCKAKVFKIGQDQCKLFIVCNIVLLSDINKLCFINFYHQNYVKI